MNSKPTNTLLRLFISIAIIVGVVFVYAKPLPDNDQADGYLLQQQQPNAAEDFVVAYNGGGGDTPISNSNGLDSPELINTDPSFGGGGFFSNPTPTIQENPTPAREGKLVALDWVDNFWEGIRQKFGIQDPKPPQPVYTIEAPLPDIPPSPLTTPDPNTPCHDGNRNNPGKQCAKSEFSQPSNPFFFFLFSSFFPCFVIRLSFSFLFL